MKALLNSLRRFSLTGLVALVALSAGYKLWDYYMDEPWTRDGHVRADVVPVAPGTTKDWQQPPFEGVIADGFIWGRGCARRLGLRHRGARPG